MSSASIEPSPGISSAGLHRRPEPEAVRICLHGTAVELACDVPLLSPELHRLFDEFAVTDWPAEFQSVQGELEPFNGDTVLRAIPSSAVNISPPDELIELYQAGDRYWVVDDRWGMAELRPLKRQWRSWLLPRPKLDPARCAEHAILWPLAQLLRFKGLTLLPAVSIAKQGWGGLILCPFGIEPELTLLLKHGYHLVGQQWTALREEAGRIAMLHLPGRVDRAVSPQRRSTGQLPLQTSVDLAAEFPHQSLHHAFCDAVLLVTPGRRTTPACRPISPSQSPGLLRRSWPLVDLQIGSRGTQLSAKLAQACPCYELQLSRTPADLLHDLDRLRNASAGH